MSKLSIVLLSLVIPFFASVADDESVALKAQSISVTVHSKSGQGSGTIITRDKVNFVLTAGHVVEGNRDVLDVISDKGTLIKQVTFTPVTVVKELYVDERSVGSTTVEGEIIAYSSSDYGQDIALLKLRSPIGTETVQFAEKTPGMGTDLIHVGSLEGQEGSNSFTTGSVSQIGRVLHDKVYDQSSCPAFPGSSGGGIFLRSSGQYVGMLVRGGGGTFNLYIPLRRMRVWAAIHHVEFLFDPKASVDLSKVVLEKGEPGASYEDNSLSLR